MTDITDNFDLASDLSTIAMYVIKSNDPGTHGKLQEAFAAALTPFEAENQRLREALRPFGDAADHAIESVGKTTTLGVLGALAPYFVTWQDFSRARAALRSTEASHDD